MTDLAVRPPRRVRQEAHRAAVEARDTSQLVTELQSVLGQALIAVLTGRDVRTVARWTAATPTRPPLETERVLRDALQVQQLLLSVDAADVVRAWFMGMNPQLEDFSPIEALAEGRARDVMAAARAFANAG